MTTKFLIVDVGMTKLIRPGLYQANHCIQNIPNKIENNTY
jgi:diaminopimelate decarboxylase